MVELHNAEESFRPSLCVTASRHLELRIVPKPSSLPIGQAIKITCVTMTLCWAWHVCVSPLGTPISFAFLSVVSSLKYISTRLVNHIVHQQDCRYCLPAEHPSYKIWCSFYPSSHHLPKSSLLVVHHDVCYCAVESQ